MVLLLTQLAHVLIGFYFLFSGFWNLYFWDQNLTVLRSWRLPLPRFILWVGVLWQIIAGGMVIFNYEVRFAAIMLIIFTLISINLFHPFWKYKNESLRKNFSPYFTNLTVTLGALLLLIAMHSQG